jgi:hypothetical protein
MARPKTEYRNEVKTRVSDRAYEGIQEFLRKNGYSSEARGISDLLEFALFGAVGTVPVQLVGSCHGLAQFGTKTAA